MSGNSPSTTCRSVRHTPQTPTLTRTSPGPGTGSSLGSNRSGAPGADRTMTASDIRHAEDPMLLLGQRPLWKKLPPSCWKWTGGYLGLTLETVSRALSQLRNQGILVFSSARQIVLRNRQRLADMDA